MFFMCLSKYVIAPKLPTFLHICAIPTNIAIYVICFSEVWQSKCGQLSMASNDDHWELDMQIECEIIDDSLQ